MEEKKLQELNLEDMENVFGGRNTFIPVRESNPLDYVPNQENASAGSGETPQEGTLQRLKKKNARIRSGL